MVTIARRTFVTTTVAAFARLTADIALDYTDAPAQAATWHIALANRRGADLGQLTFMSPLTTARESELVVWLRSMLRDNRLSDDGDIFAMQVRHDIYTLIGLCSVEQPDVRP
jgi:hypothetical protein